MDLLILAFAFLLLWKIKPVKETNEAYLSVETCQGWRGFFALVVIIHHLSQRTADGFLFRGFTSVGYLAVAVFFFLSGYGLMLKHMLDENYHKTFFVKRIPTVLFPYILITFVYWCLHAFGGTVYSFSDVFIAILKGEPIATYSWYVINILVLYLSFYLLMKITKRHHMWMILGAALFYVIWVLLCAKRSFGIWWYCSSQLFVVGVIWATYEKKIVSFTQSHFKWVLIPLVPAALTCFLLDFAVSEYWISLLLNMIAATAFTILVLLISMKFQIGNKVLDFFGKISFELYLTQGFFMLLFDEGFFPIENDFIYSVCVLLSTIGFSYVFHKLSKSLLKQFYKLR